MSNIILHPTVTRSPAQIARLQLLTGLQCVITRCGKAVHLVRPQPNHNPLPPAA